MRTPLFPLREQYSKGIILHIFKISLLLKILSHLSERDIVLTNLRIYTRYKDETEHCFGKNSFESKYLIDWCIIKGKVKA